MENGLEKDKTEIQSAFAAAGGYIYSAVQEVAAELGGEELSERVTCLAGEGLLPDPAVLELLEQVKPGAANEVMTRSQEIQKEAHQRELEELKKPSLRKYGQALLKGMSKITIFPKTR